MISVTTNLLSPETKRKIRPSLTTIRRSDNKKHTLLNNKDLTLLIMDEFEMANYGLDHGLKSFNYSTLSPSILNFK